jgi:hypothetical protein
VTDRSHWKVRKYKLGEEPEVDEETLAMTPGERIEMAWYLTWTQWMMHDPDALRAGFRRDVARVVRRGR